MSHKDCCWPVSEWPLENLMGDTGRKPVWSQVCSEGALLSFDLLAQWEEGDGKVLTKTQSMSGSFALQCEARGAWALSTHSEQLEAL